MKFLLFVTILFLTQAMMAQELEGDPVDVYGKTDIYTDLARMDKLIVEIRDYPESKGYVSLEILRNEKLYDISLRMNRILTRFRSFGVSEERVIFDVCRAERNQTTLWVVPKGAAIPVPESCKDGKMDVKKLLKLTKSKRVIKKRKS